MSDTVPFFGARALARQLLAERDELRAMLDRQAREIDRLGIRSVAELEDRRGALEKELVELGARHRSQTEEMDEALARANEELALAQARMVAVNEEALLQEVGLYSYQHRLGDAVAYRAALESLRSGMRSMCTADGGAILATTSWTVNGSTKEGRRMVRDFSKLMLRAFNAEADSLVRDLKPYKLASAVSRLRKAASTIERLGSTMSIRIADQYLSLRVRELELTADFLHKKAEEDEAERAERARLREERKAQQQLERERDRLAKERQHVANALEALQLRGDDEAVARMQAQLCDVERAIEDVDYRQANVRAGYVYAVSNVGSFGREVIKVGMTRRLDPLERIRELSDASVPFNFDVHALFFSKDAVGIEAALHSRLSDCRLNCVNLRREFFRASPAALRQHLSELAGELLEFHEEPDALEYRESLAVWRERQA